MHKECARREQLDDDPETFVCADCRTIEQAIKQSQAVIDLELEQLSSDDDEKDLMNMAFEIDQYSDEEVDEVVLISSSDDEENTNMSSK